MGTVDTKSSKFYFLLLLIIGIIQYFPQQLLAQQDSYTPINSLPGFQGPLPFQLETGYIGVDEGAVQLFYYFIKSDRNPKEDPLLIWFTGGPGCSSFCALAYEIGPLYFKDDHYNGSLPTFVLNHDAWTKVANIIFLDLPVGTGFSYATTSAANRSNDIQACTHVVQFLKKWFISHPEFVSNPFYVSGDSYAGIYVPVITHMISDENEAGLGQPINLKGYILGNPKTSPGDMNYRIPFAHGMGLISDELYASSRRSCGIDYQNLDFDNAQCSRDLEAYEQCIVGIELKNILEKNCGDDSPKLRRSLTEKKSVMVDRLGEQNNPKSALSAFECLVEGRLLSNYYFNDESVQKALHIRKGTIGAWIRCSLDLAYDYGIDDVRPYHANLSRKGYRSLIYSGDHDMEIPRQGTEAWIKDLNYSIVDDWRPWFVERQNVGYTRSFSNKMTFATVKGGGHTVPQYRPPECYAMFARWISDEAL